MAIKVANNKSLSAITALPSAISSGAMTLLSTQTASSSSTIDFTSGIDSTYDEYVFKFYDIHPQTDNTHFTVNFRDGSSAYDATKTTTWFRSQHDEANSDTALEYVASVDLAQSTDGARLMTSMSSDSDHGGNGYLHLYNPSSTTFVKNFIARTSSVWYLDYEWDAYLAGYCNVTAAIDGVQFAMSSGNIDSGVIKLYGIS